MVLSADCTALVSVASQPVSRVSAPRLRPCLRKSRRSSCRAAALERMISFASAVEGDIFGMLTPPSLLGFVRGRAARDHGRQRLRDDDDKGGVADQEQDYASHAEEVDDAGEV